jgi:hypothetical protein
MAPEPGWRRRLRDTVEMCEKVQGFGRGGWVITLLWRRRLGFGSGSVLKCYSLFPNCYDNYIILLGVLT